MLDCIYTSTKTITTGSWLGYIHMAYIKSWDALIFHDWNSPNRVYKVFRDGSQALMIPNPAPIKLWTRVYGRHAWIWTSISYSGSIWPADEISGNYHSEATLNGAWTPPAECCKAGCFVDDVNHVAVYGYVSSRIHFVDLTTGLEFPYLDLGTGSIIYDHIAWAGNGKVVAINFSAGRVALIDYLQRLIIFQSTVPACKAAAFDCLHNLVVTIESDKKVRLYIMEVVPAALSAPVFIPASAYQHRLVGSKVRTRLTGNIGEPCPDWWVHWELLGLPPKGVLQEERSKTDEDGYAENYYFGPRAVGETGSETVKVRVVLPA